MDFLTHVNRVSFLSIFRGFDHYVNTDLSSTLAVRGFPGEVLRAGDLLVVTPLVEST